MNRRAFTSTRNTLWAMTPRAAAHTPRKDDPQQEWHSLVDHLRTVAETSQRSARKFGVGELAYLTGLWHDLGKFNGAFQDYLKACFVAEKLGKPKPGKSVQHAIHGAILAMESLEPLAFLIAGHHAGITSKSKLKSAVSSPDFIEQTQLCKKAAKNCGLDLSVPAALFKELETFPQDPLAVELLLRFVFSSLVDADFLDTEAHFDPNAPSFRNQLKSSEECTTQLERLNAKLTEYQNQFGVSVSGVNQVRADVLSACVAASDISPGIFRLLVPTGGGKTLSGLRFALEHAVKHKLERVIFAVPYTSIIDQTVEVYRNILGTEAVLEHHSASRDDAFDRLEDAGEEKARARLATQNWDAPLIVTTTVQLFESLFHNRPSKCRKLHNLSKSVIVLDEVQTLPISLLQPIVSVLGELASTRYGSSVVLCTATQPALEVETPSFRGFGEAAVRDIVPQDKAKAHFASLKRVDYHADLSPLPWQALAEKVRSEQEQQVLVILNTRADALELIKTLGNTEGVLHLSTLLCGEHRRAVLADVRERLEPKSSAPLILVSTQVIEAGVDVDFPVVYRALGPLERIVQAAGRCNREGTLFARTGKLGQVNIFVPEGGGAPQGEYATALAEAAALLQKGIDFDDPAIFKGYYKTLYQGIKTDKHGIQRLRETFDFPEVADRFRLIDDDTKPVVVLYNEEANKLVDRIRRRDFLLSKDYRALQPFVVNIRRKDFEQHETLTEDIGGMHVWHGPYDEILCGISVSDWSAEDLIL